jgi:hypothetical protein
LTLLQFRNPLGINIESYNWSALAEFNGKWQPDVP